MAYEKEPHKRIADLLDAAEYLPTLFMGDEDLTETFREQLAAIAIEFPGAGIALHHFDNGIPIPRHHPK